MDYSLSLDKIELSEFDRDQLDKKIERLNKHLRQPYVIDIRIKHDTHHKGGRVVTCLINIQNGKQVFHADRSEATIQDALDASLQAVRKAIAKEHDKRGNHPSGEEAIVEEEQE